VPLRGDRYAEYSKIVRSYSAGVWKLKAKSPCLFHVAEALGHPRSSAGAPFFRQYALQAWGTSFISETTDGGFGGIKA
jgi:hypothetical protein